jgi:transcriptional regulator GlxA family with amidase domain
MFEQELLVPALHLRTEVHLRRQLRLQRAGAPLKASTIKAPSGASPSAPDGPLQGHIMRLAHLLGSTLLLSLAAAPLGPSRALAAPPAAASTVSGAGLVVPVAKAGRARPLVAVVADSEGAQTTDFIVPYGVLKESGVADVRSVSTRAGPIAMTRGLRIMTDETIADFDAREAAGADIVIVPAQAEPKSPALSRWLRAQAAKGATIISVCEGARVLANAGLLEGKRAVTHWASLQSMAKSYPATTWVRDLRYVQDGAVVTTAGVTASIPMSLALVEAIGGRAGAESTARHFGVESWTPAHRTADFAIEKADRAAAALAQRAAQETTEIPLEDGVDEVSLALEVEAWGRSMRTKVLTTHSGRTPIRSRNGLVILPDAEAKAGSHIVEAAALPAVPELDDTIAAIGRRYGAAVTRFAILAMEYDARRAGQ